MRKSVLILLFLFMGAVSGCASMRFVWDSEFSRAGRFMQEKKYPEAIGIYQKIAKDSSGSARGADGLFLAARARSSYDNPHRDYALALQEFDEFLRRYPDSKKVREAQNWRALLKTVVDLKKENEKLNQSIEQLKKIDIKHEERRKRK